MACPMREIHLLLLSILMAWPRPAHAIPEENYSAGFRSLVAPFVASTGRKCEFVGERGVKIACMTFAHERSRGAIVIVSGYTEHMGKYHELAYDLFERGYSVFLYDHRGQGHSQRLLASAEKATIDEFHFLVADLDTFIQTKVPVSAGPLYVAGHSLGGAVTARYLQTKPTRARAAALFAPMLKINLGRWPEWLAKLVLALDPWFGWENDYARDPEDMTLIPFETNVVSNSRPRHELNKEFLRAEPRLKIAGQTRRWIREALRGSGLARGEEAERIAVPVIVFQAGLDPLVAPAGHEQFCAKVRRCRIERLPTAKHEILQETDAIRGPALERMLGFFEASTQK